MEKDHQTDHTHLYSVHCEAVNNQINLHGCHSPHTWRRADPNRAGNVAGGLRSGYLHLCDADRHGGVLGDSSPPDATEGERIGRHELLLHGQQSSSNGVAKSHRARGGLKLGLCGQRLDGPRTIQVLAYCDVRF